MASRKPDPGVQEAKTLTPYPGALSGDTRAPTTEQRGGVGGGGVTKSLPPGNIPLKGMVPRTFSSVGLKRSYFVQHISVVYCSTQMALRYQLMGVKA